MLAPTDPIEPEDLLENLGRRKTGVEEAPLQGELMLFEPSSSRFFVLNPTMTVVWRHCDGQTAVEEAADELMKAFEGIERTKALEDLREARKQLLELGLVE